MNHPTTRRAETRRRMLLAVVVLAATSSITAQNLVTNGDFELGDTGFFTELTPSPTGLPHSVYDVRDDPQSWNPNFSDCVDHTSGTGLMMCINGNGSLALVVWGQDIETQPGLSYEFVLHAQSLHPSNPASLVVEINGEEVGSLQLTPVTCQWEELRLVWPSGTASTASVQVIDKTLNPTGDDFALDDIALRVAGTWSDLGGGTVGVDGQPTLSGDGTLLAGSTASVSLTNAPPSALMLAWISIAPTPFAALGGRVHAYPFASQLLVFADATGSFGASTTWPAGVPPGTNVYFQFIVEDLSVPAGLTLSNGLQATTP